MGLSEHNVSISNAIWRKRLSEGIQQSRPGRIAHQFNSGPEFDTTGHLMGGTGIITIDDITGRIEPGGKGGDAMGRWSFMHFRRYRLPPVTVISVYQVCKRPTNLIGHTAWHQQRRFLDMQQRAAHPREAFLHDLEIYIQSLQRQGHAIIVGGDWNDWMASSSSSILKLCTSLQLVDPWLLQHPNAPDFATHEHGSHRIDSILISTELQSMIKAVRYSPVGLFGTTDHRAVLLELDQNALFGSPLQHLPSPMSRSVWSKDRQSVTKFIEQLHHHLHHNNVFNRSRRLATNNPSDTQLVEQLDRILGEAGRSAETKCRRRRPQWYSNQLVKCRQTVSLLRHHLQGLKCRIDRSATVQQRLLNMGENITMSMDIPVVKNQIRQFENQLHDLEQDHESRRRAQLAASADVATAAGNENKARAIRTISKSEQNLRTWKILQFMTSSDQTPRLDRLEIPESWPEYQNQSIDDLLDLEDPKTATTWKTVVDPKAIEFYLMVRNYQHFGQAHGTPFTVGPLSEDIDWTATSQHSEEILRGSYAHQHNVTELCTRLLAHCKKLQNEDSVSVEVTESDFQGKIKSWKERTITSPSGRHLGWYKALYADGEYDSNSPEDIAFRKKQQDIRKVILHIMNYCINTGHPLTRWCKVVNTMIFKEPGVYKVHRLRVIHLFEADLNLLYAVKWRSLVSNVNNRNGLHPGQYGGRPGYEATSMSLLEELRIDTTYLTRRTLVTFDNDAASCYDRIVINLASLINRKYGMPSQITRLHGEALKHTRYTIRTALGVSETAYRNQPSRPLYGTGQGAGNSPGIWLLISNLLFELYDRESFGAHFVTANGEDRVRLSISGFVDDTNAVSNSFQPQDELPLQTIIQQMRHDAQLWSDLLHISGGKLELTKCSYQVLTFTFLPNGTPVVSHQSFPSLTLQDPATGNAHEVKHRPLCQAHRILGHWKSSGNQQQKTQLREITHKADKVSLLIASSPLSRTGATLAYTSKYLASLRFVLPQCWFTPKILHRHERKSMSRIIAKCGCARTTPHSILYAPFEFAGAGFVHWETIQGEGQLKQFVKHWRTNTEVSKMLRVAVSWAQWQAGTKESIFQKVHRTLPNVEGRWILSLRCFLATINGTLHLDNAFVPPCEREGDYYIMEHAMSLPNFSHDDLRIINYCRLYLHVTTLSELCDVSGRSIMPDMFECKRPPWFDPSITTVLQNRPSEYQCKYQWKRFCRTICTADLILGQAWALGNWKVEGHQLRLRREAYIHKGQHPTLYIWHDNKYWTTENYMEGTKLVLLSQATSWQPTSTSIPIDVHRISPRRFLLLTTASYTLSVPDGVKDPVYDFHDHIQQSPQWIQPFLQNIHWLKEPYELMHFLSTRSNLDLLVVSDGSCNDGATMSYGVVIGTSDGTRLLTAQGPAGGTTSSHRAECYGSLAGAVILQNLCLYTRMSLPMEMKILSMSDNQGMIQRLQDRQTYNVAYANSTLAPDWDMVEEIHQSYKALHLKHHVYEWVKGHQDSGAAKTLTTAAKFNIEADSLAGEYYLMGALPLPSATAMLPHTKCILRINGRDIHGHYGSYIRRATAQKPFRDYVTKRHGWQQKTFDDIDWNLFHNAASNFDGDRIHLMKLVHDKLPTNMMKSRYRQHTSSLCHFCSYPETFNHLCTSQCNARSQMFRHNMTQAITEFLYEHTPRQFAITFLSALRSWFEESNKDGPDLWDGPTRLQRHQKCIGWSQMFKGFFTKSWSWYLGYTIQTCRVRKWLHENEPTSTRRAIPDAYNPYVSEKFLSKPMSPTRILSRLIRVIWQHMGSLWHDHTNFIHASSTGRSSPVHRQELQAQIRALHSLKTLTLSAHRDQYFYPDLDEYLNQASNLQMRRYISRYRPVILNSLRQATKVATTALPLTTFFPRTIPVQAKQPSLHPTQEEPMHRKHTRRRIPLLRRITEFFRPAIPKPDDHPP